MSWEISWALCRACMSADSELFPMYDDTEATENGMLNQLAELAEIEISRSDGLPTRLCKECILKIKAYHEFKELVRESNRKLKKLFDTEIVFDPKSNEIVHEVKGEAEDQVQDQSTEQIEDQIEKQLEQQIEDEDQVKIKIQYAESEIDVMEDSIFEDQDESCASHTEENSIENLNQNVNSLVGEEAEIVDSSKIDDMWQIMYAVENSENNVEESNPLQLISTVINEESDKEKTTGKDERKRKPSRAKAKSKKKCTDKKESIQKVATDTKETGSNSDSSDVDSYGEDNIVGSLNETITKVKEIKVNGKVTHYQCTLCLQNYKILSEAVTHIVDMHVPANGPFFCVVCEMDCDTIKHLKNHVKIHQGENPYICFLCNKAYVRKRYLQRHMVCHTDFHRQRCPKCGQRFKFKFELEAHVKTHTDITFHCRQCPRVFNHKGNYKRHLISHLDPKGVHIPRYPCPVCNKRFLNNRILENHLRVHTGEKPYKCDLCDKAFSQKGNLINHGKVHTNPRCFTCDVCGKKFNQKATLRDHSKLHTGEKPYVCTVCGVAFTFSSALGRHMWTHSDKKPHECDLCDASFIGLYDLRRHKKVHNNGKSKRIVKSKNMDEEKVIEVSEEVFNAVQEASDNNTIVIEQIFLCENSIEIISPEESEKENADTILTFV